MGDTQHKNVYVALAAAQMAMEPLIKGAINPAFKGEGVKKNGTAYADLSDVVSAVRPALVSNGLAYFHQIVRHGEALDMRTALVHGESDTRIECDVPLIVAKNDMQGMKSATTYAKRIGLESVTGVAPEDDDGNAAAAAKPNAKDDAEAREKAKAADQAKHDRAVDQAIIYIGEADSVDALKQSWLNLPTVMKEDGRVIKAKDDRKAALTKNADLDGDNIPYEGK